MTAFEPSSTALLIAIVIPRSLNDPVGLAPSTFKNTSHPVSFDSTGAGSSGVPPSCSVTTGVASVTGSHSRYSSINPRQRGRASRKPAGPAPVAISRCPRPRPASRWRRRVGGRVRDNDQARVVAMTGLTHRLNRDVVGREHRRDLREHTGLIGDIE